MSIIDLTQINLKELPSPKGHLILGHYPQFKSSAKHLFLEQSVKECGELYSVNLFGKKFIVSAIHELNNQILKLRPEKFKRLPKIDSVLQEIGIFGVFNAEGEDWKRHRKLTTESLSLKKVKQYYKTVLKKSEKLLDKLDAYAIQGTTIDIQKEFMLFTVDVTTAIAFGYETNTIEGHNAIFQEHLEQIFIMLNKRNVSPIPLWKWYKSKKDKQLDESLKSIEHIIYDFINHTKKTLKNNFQKQKQPSNFLEALLIENSEGEFNDKEVYGNIFTMLMAGEDSTSSSLAWIIYYLCQHPSVVTKIRNEAYQVYKNYSCPNTFKEYQNLTYTNAVIQETLRLHPTTTQQIVESNEDCTVNGLTIAKGTCFILLNRYAQREEKYFSEASKFIPERWLNTKCPIHKVHSPQVVKAFGGGSRLCPGKNLAISEMVTIISILCKHYNFLLETPVNKIHEKHAFIVYPENLYIKLEKVTP